MTDGPTVLFEVDATDNMQGLTHHDGHYFIGFDMGGGNGKIRKYDGTGRVVQESGLIGIGHSASLAYRKENGNIYVANGGGRNPTKVYEVDMDTLTVVSEIDFSKLGNSGLIATDNGSDQLLVHTAPSDLGKITFNLCSFDGTLKRQFTIANKGVPQGLDIYQNRVYYYTNNTITVMDMNGKVLDTIKLSERGESEGITVTDDFIAFGYNKPNRIYRLEYSLDI